MRKRIAKAGMAAMAVAMMMQPQVTAKAAEGGSSGNLNSIATVTDWPVAEMDGAALEQHAYMLPRCYDKQNADYAKKSIGDIGSVRIGFLSKRAVSEYYLQNVGVNADFIPAGYEVKGVEISDSAIMNTNNEFCLWPSTVEVENSQDWARVDGYEARHDADREALNPFYYANESFQMSHTIMGEGGRVAYSCPVYDEVQFSVNYNGTLYRECKLYITGGDVGGQNYYFVVVPQGYDGNIKLTVYGGKWVDGKEVKDETAYVVYYINGSAEAQQPAASDEDRSYVWKHSGIKPAFTWKLDARGWWIERMAPIWSIPGINPRAACGITWAPTGIC